MCIEIYRDSIKFVHWYTTELILVQLKKCKNDLVIKIDR